MIVIMITTGIVTAVSITSNTESIEGARGTTTDGAFYIATQPGTRIALNADAGAATSPIVPGNDAATTLANASAVTAGEFIYEMAFTEDTGVDGAPVATFSARWTVGGVENTATDVAVNALASDGTPAQGGFTIIIPGDSINSPEDIQVLLRH